MIQSLGISRPLWYPLVKAHLGRIHYTSFEHAIWNKTSFLHYYPYPQGWQEPSIALYYRLIALTACMIKLFEKIINSHLIWFLEKGGHLSILSVAIDIHALLLTF